MRKIKKRYKVMLVILFCLFAVCAYYNSGYYIRKHEWKHSRKSSFGDWVELKTGLYSLNWRTIYKNNKEVGKVIFCFENYLIIYVKEDDVGVGYYYKKK